MIKIDFRYNTVYCQKRPAIQNTKTKITSLPLVFDCFRLVLIRILDCNFQSSLENYNIISNTLILTESRFNWKSHKQYLESKWKVKLIFHNHDSALDFKVHLCDFLLGIRKFKISIPWNFDFSNKREPDDFPSRILKKPVWIFSNLLALSHKRNFFIFKTTIQILRKQSIFIT